MLKVAKEFIEKLIPTIPDEQEWIDGKYICTWYISYYKVVIESSKTSWCFKLGPVEDFEWKHLSWSYVNRNSDEDEFTIKIFSRLGGHWWSNTDKVLSEFEKELNNWCIKYLDNVNRGYKESNIQDFGHKA